MESKSVKFHNRTEWKNESGELHRLDGPAVQDINGNEYWFKDGELHRLDGPAIDEVNGMKLYYIDGSRYHPLFLEFEKIINRIEKYEK